MVSSWLVGETWIMFKALARAGFSVEILRYFWRSIIKMMRMRPASITGRSRLEMLTEPGPSSKNKCASSRQRIMFLAA